jgi:RimJ/RimL family protein N-acetyltransferase
MAWAIIEKAEDQFIGIMDYMTEDNGSGNRGFWLAGPWQGRGYMTEAVIAVQDYLFFELQLDRIVVKNAVDNPASRRIKEKTGARRLGTTQFAHRNGCSETEIWEVTRESWAKLRGRTP